MTKSPRKNVPNVGIELGAACIPSEFASDRATAPGQYKYTIDNKTSQIRGQYHRLIYNNNKKKYNM